MSTTVNGIAVEKGMEAYGLVRLDAEAVAKLWPDFIRPGLLQIKRKDRRDSTTWLPEHVRAYIEAGLAGKLFCECHMIVPVSGTKPVGFVILRTWNDEYAQVPLSMLVWIAYAKFPWKGIRSSIRTALTHVLPAIEKRSRELGLRYVYGVSPRMHGWLGVLMGFGYQVHQVVFRKDLYPEGKP